MINNDSCSYRNCENILFNPFEFVVDENNALPCDDYDPDLHYYSQSQKFTDLCNSNYYDIDQFNNNSSPPKKDKQFSMYHCNIRSVTKNGNNLSNHLKALNHEFDIICLSETWLNKTNHEVVGFPDYSHVCNYRESKMGGGVSILLKNGIQYHELTDLTSSTDIIECSFVQIEMTGKNVIIGCIYRPPNSNLQGFTDEMCNISHKLSNLNNHVYLLGDYNVDLLKFNKHQPTSDFINTMFSFSFLPLINRPTRITDNSATIIDNIFTNCHSTHDYCSGIIPTDVSDHFSIFHIIYNNSTPETSKPEYNLQRTINDNTITNCISVLRKTEWDNVLNSNDPETAYDIFQGKLSKVINDTMPMQRHKINNKKSLKPWITKGLLVSIANKNAMYKRLKITGDRSLEVQYKTIKNKLSNLLRSCEKTYYKNKLEQNKNNLSKLWKTLNTVINRKKISNKNVTFKHNNKEIVNNLDIANHFNKYYLNITKEISSKIPKCSEDPCKYMTDKLKSSFFFTPTDEDEILEIILKLKNSSPGHDGLSVNIIKKIKCHILTPLTHIINLSFSNGIIPDNLKIAKVIPIYKRGDHSLFANYRPISILPAFSKIIEKLAYKRIILFLDKFNILNDGQFGFRKNRSTDMAIHTLMDKLYESIENDKISLGIFIDFSRAFDTISHDILLKKLQFYGFRGKAHDWIKNYLTNRKQFVAYNNSHSQLGDVTIWVPQGSILGPLLFLLYVNDIYAISKQMSCIQFADDTTLLASGNNLTDLTCVVNTELRNINQWINLNKLSLNIAKTSYMVMSGSSRKFDTNNCKIFINDQCIEQVNQTKFLGVIIDDKLTWNLHIDHICNKVSKGIGILLRARQVLYGQTLITLYNALIKPHFMYCITVWGNTYKKYLNKLQLVQKKIIRIITYSEFSAHTAPLLDKLNILNIHQLIEYFVGIFIYKSLHHDLSNSLCDLFIRNFNARNSDNLRSTYHKKKISQQSIRIAGPRIWNNLSNICKKSLSLNSFKKTLNKCIRSK